MFDDTMLVGFSYLYTCIERKIIGRTFVLPLSCMVLEYISHPFSDVLKKSWVLSCVPSLVRTSNDPTFGPFVCLAKKKQYAMSTTRYQIK